MVLHQRATPTAAPPFSKRDEHLGSASSQTLEPALCIFTGPSPSLDSLEASLTTTQQPNSHLCSYTGGSSSGEGNSLFSGELISNPTQPDLTQPNPSFSCPPPMPPISTTLPLRSGGIMSNFNLTTQPRPQEEGFTTKKRKEKKLFFSLRMQWSRWGGGVRQRCRAAFPASHPAAEASGSRAVHSNPRQRSETPRK